MVSPRLILLCIAATTAAINSTKIERESDSDAVPSGVDLRVLEPSSQRNTQALDVNGSTLQNSTTTKTTVASAKSTTSIDKSTESTTDLTTTTSVPSNKTTTSTSTTLWFSSTSSTIPVNTITTTTPHFTPQCRQLVEKNYKFFESCRFISMLNSFPVNGIVGEKVCAGCLNPAKRGLLNTMHLYGCLQFESFGLPYNSTVTIHDITAMADQFYCVRDRMGYYCPSRVPTSLTRNVSNATRINCTGSAIKQFANVSCCAGSLKENAAQLQEIGAPLWSQGWLEHVFQSCGVVVPKACSLWQAPPPPPSHKTYRGWYLAAIVISSVCFGGCTLLFLFLCSLKEPCLNLDSDEPKEESTEVPLTLLSGERSTCTSNIYEDSPSPQMTDLAVLHSPNSAEYEDEEDAPLLCIQ